MSYPFWGNPSTEAKSLISLLLFFQKPKRPFPLPRLCTPIPTLNVMPMSSLKLRVP